MKIKPNFSASCWILIQYEHGDVWKCWGKFKEYFFFRNKIYQLVCIHRSENMQLYELQVLIEHDVQQFETNFIYSKWLSHIIINPLWISEIRRNMHICKYRINYHFGSVRSSGNNIFFSFKSVVKHSLKWLKFLDNQREPLRNLFDFRIHNS